MYLLTPTEVHDPLLSWPISVFDLALSESAVSLVEFLNVSRVASSWKKGPKSLHLQGSDHLRVLEYDPARLLCAGGLSETSTIVEEVLRDDLDEFSQRNLQITCPIPKAGEAEGLNEACLKLFFLHGQLVDVFIEKNRHDHLPLGRELFAYYLKFRSELLIVNGVLAW